MNEYMHKPEFTKFTADDGEEIVLMLCEMPECEYREEMGIDEVPCWVGWKCKRCGKGDMMTEEDLWNEHGITKPKLPALKHDR